jgi:hypothetical protein
VELWIAASDEDAAYLRRSNGTFESWPRADGVACACVQACPRLLSPLTQNAQTAPAPPASAAGGGTERRARDRQI